VIADLARFFHTSITDLLAMDWGEVAAWYAEAERIGTDELRASAWRN
jgi:hypothetical protein